MSITFDELAIAMIKCPQTEEQSVYQHGVSVKEHVQDLIYHLDSNLPSTNWKLPDWIYLYRNDIISNLHDEDTISKYTVFHDCGKFFCKTIDEAGKTHFPNHAQKSKEVWLEAGGEEIVAKLIGCDMDLHTMNSDEIKNRCENDWSVKDACTLILVAFAEIHSNSKLFGGELGIKSEQFKIKWKSIDRRGKQICKHYFGGLNEKQNSQGQQK